MKSKLFKYKLGLGVIGVFTLVGLVLVLTQASAVQQDHKTLDSAQKLATKLNGYVNNKGSVPTLLTAVQTDVTDAITYQKLDDSHYKFCVTFKAAGENFDASSALTTAIFRGASDSYNTSQTDSSYESSYLYIPSNYHKGENCQTIKAYTYDSSSSGDGYDYSTDTSTSGSGSLFGDISGINSKARDTERTTDLKTLQSQLEAYYANNGYYPLLSNLNDATWLKTNMVGMDRETLRDPQGSDYKLAAKAGNNMYGYTSTTLDGKTCDNVSNSCDTYVLTAQLEGGSTLTLNSLN